MATTPAPANPVRTIDPATLSFAERKLVFAPHADLTAAEAALNEASVNLGRSMIGEAALKTHIPSKLLDNTFRGTVEGTEALLAAEKTSLKPFAAYLRASSARDAAHIEVLEAQLRHLQAEGFEKLAKDLKAPLDYVMIAKTDFEHAAKNTLKMLRNRHATAATNLAQLEHNWGKAALEPLTQAANAAGKESPGFWAKMFPSVKEKGFGAIGDHFGGEAWKKATVRTGFRTAGVAAGALLVGHGALKGQYQNDAGEMQDRSTGLRVVEVASGAGLAVLSALAGGRGR